MLRKFGNIIIETDDVSALIGRMLVMKNGKTHGIDVESANAMREAFTPHSCNNRYERSPDISHKAKEHVQTSSRRSREYIDRLCRHNSEWINSLIKVELGSAARDLVADIYETADGYWNLAHIHNADFRGPDLRIRIAKGESLVKVGAGEFRFVISPVAFDLHDSPDCATSGGKSADHRQEPNNQR